MHNFCNTEGISPNDHDCEDCARYDDEQSACCFDNCEFVENCQKACSKFRKHKEMEQWTTSQLFDNLQNWILSKSDEMPFAFDILWDRFNKKHEVIPNDTK